MGRQVVSCEIAAKFEGGTQMPELNGGCLCGAVRYTTNAAPEFVGLCHCTDCQKHTGSRRSLGCVTYCKRPRWRWHRLPLIINRGTARCERESTARTGEGIRSRWPTLARQFPHLLHGLRTYRSCSVRSTRSWPRIKSRLSVAMQLRGAQSIGEITFSAVAWRGSRK
jgi:hypothetical protein